MSLLAACADGSDDAVDTVDAPPTTTGDCRPIELVDAADVQITGRRVDAVAGIILSTERLTDGQQEMVGWSLSRFGAAGLRLPPRIDVVFDQTRSLCHGDLGGCRPDQETPIIYVCGREEPSTSAEVLDQKMVLLHELAHVWHWSRGDGSGWPDYSAIVGGEQGDGSVPAFDRAEERVAMIITWGLLDQEDRPVLENLSCEDRYLMFQSLTGGPPLAPLEPTCVLP